MAPVENVHIVVVGAGIAGLRAARTLLDHSPNIHVTVLEANDKRYGGRVWSFEIPGHPGKLVELGGMWMHDANCGRARVMQKFCKNNTIPTMRNVANATNVQVFMGSSIDVFASKDYLKELLYVYELVDDLGNLAPVDLEIPEHSVYEALHNSNTKLARKYAALSPVAQKLFVLCMEDFEAASIHDLSMTFFQPDSDSESDSSDSESESESSDSDDDPEGELRDFSNGDIVVSGMSTVLQSIVMGTNQDSREVEVKLDQRVTEIRLLDGGSEVEIKTANNHIYHADFAIVAVPLGVLKSDDITWYPPLDKSKKDSISRMGFGNFAKIVLIFDHLFWPRDKDFIYFLPEESGLPRCYFVSLYNINGVAGLIGHLNGPQADWADTLTDADLESKLLDVLKMTYGESFAKLQPSVTYRKRWSWRKDPLVRGAFSFGKHGMKESDPAVIAQPISNRIFFAGEHTMYDEDMNAEIGGAFWSGINAAKGITKLL